MSEVESRPLQAFATKRFSRFAASFGADHALLWDTLQESPEADLGGGVYKYRLARKGESARGGARAIVAVKAGERMVMMYGFEKKDKANISKKDLQNFRQAAKVYLGLTEAALTLAVADRTLVKITRRGER